MQKLGLSGDIIKIQDKHVYKVCQTDQSRFLKNIKKQNNFINSYINAVPILDQGIINGNNFIKMPLLQCENSLIWLSKTNIENINNLIITITNYFNSIIENSKIQIFNNKKWENKIESIYGKVLDKDLQFIIEKIYCIDTSKLFYYGECHGDFTLSNLFITQNKNNISIDAIDFLDVFINSPIHDLVKIRQDTKHLWTLKLLEESLDKNRIIIVLNYIDEKIAQIINGNDIISHYYLYFQILNLLRIIPYNKDPAIFAYLKQEIQELSVCLQH